MLDPIKMLACGKSKQDRYLQEAERHRLIKASAQKTLILSTRLVQGMMQRLLGQRLPIEADATRGKTPPCEATLVSGKKPFQA